MAVTNTYPVSQGNKPVYKDGLSQQKVSELPRYSIWGNQNYDEGFGIAISEENIYTVGYTNLLGSLDLVLIKWNKTGGQVWNRTWGGWGNNIGKGVAVDGDGNIYTAGTAWGNNIGKGVAVDGDKNIYTVGTADFSVDTRVLLLVKWDKTGRQVWNRTWSDIKGVWEEEGQKVVVDFNGSIYTIGSA
ncbi:MAG: SBBP repeat-containing protein, partial [Promethearchaeota archaeon]